MTTLRKTIEDHEEEISRLRGARRRAYVQGIHVECPVEHPGVQGEWKSWRDGLEGRVKDPRAIPDWSPLVIAYPLADELPLPEADE